MSDISLDEFTESATEFLEANAARRGESKFVWGEGSDRVGILEEKTPEQEQREVAEAKDWKQKEFDAGFGWITGPTEYGGRGAGCSLRACVPRDGGPVLDPVTVAVRDRARHGRPDHPRPRDPRGP